MLFLVDMHGLWLQRVCSTMNLPLALPSAAMCAFSLPPPPSFPSVSHHCHHHIMLRWRAPASCSTITSPNPPPTVCISAVLIAPETQSNGQEMRGRVQLTGYLLFLVSLSLFSLLNISPFSDTLTLFSGFPFRPSASKPEWASCPNCWESCLLLGCSHCCPEHQQTECWWGRATELPHAVHTAHLPVPHGEDWKRGKLVLLHYYCPAA